MDKGAIAAGAPATAAAGAALLARGGNAVDAAVAGAFASFVAEATIVNIGGSGIGLVVDRAENRHVTYDFFSDMPSGTMHAAADFRAVVIDFGTEQQPFHIGRASVAVPGAVAGLCAMAEAHGTLPLSQLLEPAIELADKGAPLSSGQTYAYQILQPIYRDTPELAALYLPRDRQLTEGELMRFPALGRSLRRLALEGPDLFYRGDLAQAIVCDQVQHGGLLMAEDLDAYQVHACPPIEIEYRDHTILLPPPASSGGALIAFALKLLVGWNPGTMAHNSLPHLRLLTEVMRLTNVARSHWDSIGDEQDGVARFLDDEHVKPFARRLTDIMAGAAPPFNPPESEGPNDTTHISVVDGQGNLASITTSAGENAGFVVGDTGICLNNMLGESDLHPNGFHNLAPGRRLSTMMTPTIVMRGGEPVLAVGSGGSSRIRSAILQVLSNMIDFQLPIEIAINSPRIHYEAQRLQAEGGIAAPVTADLERLGYQVNRWPGSNMYFGGAHAVAYVNGHPVPAGDARRGGSVALV